MEQLVKKFEESVRQGLIKAGVSSFENLVIGAAVSGGADSIAMLTSLKNILPQSCKLIAVTVNHNIRPKEESVRDAEYVQEYCKALNIKCIREDIVPGKLKEKAKSQNLSLEALARDERYKIFNKVINNENISYFCLAHNKNDRIETLLMHFLQGSISSIPEKREKFIRPLLNIERSQIEEYLKIQNISYRTDLTNFDTTILRNKIRHNIIPFLDSEVKGWSKAVLNLELKNSLDEDLLKKLSDEAFTKIEFNLSSDTSSFKRNCFSALEESIKIRVLYKALSENSKNNNLQKNEPAELSKRVPFRNIYFLSKELSSEKEKIQWESEGITIKADKGNVYITSKKNKATETGFYYIIECEKKFIFESYNVNCKKKENSIIFTASIEEREIKTLELKNTSFPIAFRSFQCGDTIKDAFGKNISVRKIFSNWKYNNNCNTIPCIQSLGTEEQPLIALWGELRGTKNWIIKTEA